LQQWSGSDTVLIPADTALLALPPPVPDSAQLAANASVQLQKQKLLVAEAQWHLERSKWAPSLQLGAFTQSIDHATPFWGYSIGASIPLFKTGNRVRPRSAASI
jgi:outer membrane protein TolC